ncbi:hypothetical protein D7319_12400 [Streptomyces radicis]|uniref:Uncharacterized protein n=1 Tax=Streptomyces radicis TaxID=1750517 RepID=A0A3A9WA78_9ACTN|nr:hypothetical protein D7319_12400 [Streptomyces radicis]RKN23139.1 hypothetical protein D7318_14125 [Streptomyces radicis]
MPKAPLTTQAVVRGVRCEASRPARTRQSPDAREGSERRPWRNVSTLPDLDRRPLVFPHPFPHDRLHLLRAAELERAARLSRLLHAVRRRRR